MHTPLLQHRHFNRLVLSVLAAGFLSHFASCKALAQASTASANKAVPTVLVLGDSLSAEYGLTRGTGWVQAMRTQADKEGLKLNLINASISGDTTSGGVTRLPALLKLHEPKIVIIELGGNDALRGLSLSLTQQNLLSLVQASQHKGSQALLIAMQVPPNYGASYRQRMGAVYLQVSQQTGATLNDTFLKGIADDADPLKWFQADRIHPNEGAQSTMMKNVWPQLKKMLGRAAPAP